MIYLCAYVSCLTFLIILFKKKLLFDFMLEKFHFLVLLWASSNTQYTLKLLTYTGLWDDTTI